MIELFYVLSKSKSGRCLQVCTFLAYPYCHIVLVPFVLAMKLEAALCFITKVAKQIVESSDTISDYEKALA